MSVIWQIITVMNLYSKSINLVREIHIISADLARKKEKMTLIQQFKTYIYILVAADQSSPMIESLVSNRQKKDIKTAVCR